MLFDGCADDGRISTTTSILPIFGANGEDVVARTRTTSERKRSRQDFVHPNRRDYLEYLEDKKAQQQQQKPTPTSIIQIGGSATGGEGVECAIRDDGVVRFPKATYDKLLSDGFDPKELGTLDLRVLPNVTADPFAVPQQQQQPLPSSPIFL